MKKLGWLSMCLFLLLFKPAFTQVATETETEMVQITLHKLLFPNGQLPKIIQMTDKKKLYYKRIED